MHVTTDSGLQLVLERTRAEVANSNGEVPTVHPSAFGGSVMGAWGTNLPATTPWQGWPTDWGTTWNGVGMTTRVGVAMTACDLNSRVLATMPTYVLRDDVMIESPAWTANPEPSLYSDWSEPAKQLVNSLLLRGEAFCYCTGRYTSPNGITPGQVKRWAVLNPDQTGVQAVDGAIEYRLNGQPIARREPGTPLNQTDVLHLRYQSWPGYLHGMGPLEWTAANAMGAAAMEAYVANLATRGGVPWAVLKHPRNLNDTQASDLQTAWVEAAARRNGAPAVLSGGIELEILQLSPKDMALLDLRVFDEQRVSSAFGVPPFLIGLPQADGLVYSNAQSLFDYHWRSMLRPLAQTIAAGLSAWALAAGQSLEFDPDKYVQPPLAERAQTYATLFGIVDPETNERAISVAEIRARERFAPDSTHTAVELTGQTS